MSIYGEALSGGEGITASLSAPAAGKVAAPGPGLGAKCAPITSAWSGLTKNAKLVVVAGAAVLLVLCPLLWYFFGTSEGAPVCTVADPTRCFVPVKKSMTWPEASSYCNSHYAGLASIHSVAEQKVASTACMSLGVSRVWAADETGLPHG